jgi:putative transposase
MSSFNAWYRRYLEGGPEAPQDRKPAPRRVWAMVPPEITEEVVELALELPQLSPRELATAITDRRRCFIS